jgi:hypothetical protein
MAAALPPRRRRRLRRRRRRRRRRRQRQRRRPGRRQQQLWWRRGRRRRRGGGGGGRWCCSHAVHGRHDHSRSRPPTPTVAAVATPSDSDEDYASHEDDRVRTGGGWPARPRRVHPGGGRHRGWGLAARSTTPATAPPSRVGVPGVTLQDPCPPPRATPTAAPVFAPQAPRSLPIDPQHMMPSR